MQRKLFGCGALSHAFSQFSNNNLYSYCQMIYYLGMLRHLFRAINLNLVKMIHSSYLEQLLASVVNSSFFAFSVWRRSLNGRFSLCRSSRWVRGF